MARVRESQQPPAAHHPSKASHHSVGVCRWTRNWVQIRLNKELDLNGKSVSSVHPPSIPLWCALVVAVGFTLAMCESARGSSFSSMNKTNSCRFSAGGRAQLSPEWPNGLFLGKLGFSVEAEEAQLPISHSNAVKTAMKEICDNVQSSMIAKQKNLKGHQNFVWEAEKALHASSLDKIPSVQAILNLDLEMENKLPAPRCKTIVLANFLKDCRGQHRHPCTHQSRYWSPSALQLATMAICLF